MAADVLPIHAVLEELIDALRARRAAVLVAPPGTGKTTGVPPALLAAGIAGDGQLLLLEPRRVAARASAARMAAALGESVGDRVGYQVRFDRRASDRTRILVITEGILTRRFVSDPFLDGVSVVVLDEFHERSVHSDLALAFCRELIQVREDLSVLVMSATLDASAVSRYLDGCPVVRGEGRCFPVTIEHVPAADPRSLPIRAAAGVRTALARDPEKGDLLVFLPGAGDIRRTAAILEEAPPVGRPAVVLLYGALPPDQQDRALWPGKGRRVVLATNIAETSLTIPGVTAVVDSGLAKVNRYDPRVGLDRLETIAISAQSATQRAGRAGRLAPGTVLRLWTAYENRGRPTADVPEIQRVDPAAWLLHVLAFHPGDPRRFDLLDAPAEALLAEGIGLLRHLGALETDGFGVTPLGHRLAALPVHPRLGSILLEAASRNQPALGAAVVALASERDIRRSDSGGREAPSLTVDFEHRLEMLQELERRGSSWEAAAELGVSRNRARVVRQAQKALMRMVPSPADRLTEDVSPGQLLLAGFPDRVCRLRPDGRSAVMVGGRGVRLRAPLEGGDLFIALEADAGRRGQAESVVFLAAPLNREMLSETRPDLMTRESHITFDEDGGRVTAKERVCFSDLVIDERPAAEIAPEVGGAVLAREASGRWPRAFSLDKQTLSLLDRMAFARQSAPEIPLPDLMGEGLRSFLEPLCYGLRSLSELVKLDWFHVIGDHLSYDVRQQLSRRFPERLVIPTGREAPLDYAPAVRGETPGPVLACRIQELFGLFATPSVDGGRFPVTLHLLAPNGRPCQITRDLSGFWKRTYAEVRKELKGRYPKHYWPEDPYTATPTSRVRPGRAPR